MQTGSKQDLAHQGEVVVKSFLSRNLRHASQTLGAEPGVWYFSRLHFPLTDFDFLRDRIWLLEALRDDGSHFSEEPGASPAASVPYLLPRRSPPGGSGAARAAAGLG